ncbi:Hypothetical predicted protein [Cloeon dipterum]|uniref:Uncharacterized protein n=1 Tax=Cloeon dipterum TaxID=197152 RepID=A0A8S1DL89_9INSE|nr:Hypothetical predicted protein [Cloeon dipterum]
MRKDRRGSAQEKPVERWLCGCSPHSSHSRHRCSRPRKTLSSHNQLCDARAAIGFFLETSLLISIRLSWHQLLLTKLQNKQHASGRRNSSKFQHKQETKT